MTGSGTWAGAFTIELVSCVAPISAIAGAEAVDAAFSSEDNRG